MEVRITEGWGLEKRLRAIADEMVNVVLPLGWVALSVALVVGLRVFSGERLRGALVRRGELTLWLAAGLFLVYFGGQVMVEVAAALLHGAAMGGAATQTSTQAATMEAAKGSEVGLMVAGSIGSVIYGVVLVGALVFVLRRIMEGGVEGWGLGRRWVAGMGWGIVGYVVVMPWLQVVEVGMEKLLGLWGMTLTVHPTIVALEDMAQQARPFDKAMLVLAAGVVAPVVEEMVFRGIIQTALVQQGWGIISRRGRRWENHYVRGEAGGVLDYAREAGVEGEYRPSAGHRWGAIAITAGLFAGIHFMPTQFPVLFVLGLALGYVYERTGNLWASITLHALFNCVTLGVLLAGGGG